MPSNPFFLYAVHGAMFVLQNAPLCLLLFIFEAVHFLALINSLIFYALTR